jgi:hypothetical protein
MSGEGAGKAAENKDIFDGKAEIERAFGGELSWQRLDDKQGSLWSSGRSRKAAAPPASAIAS